jgi:hypothetical protein
LVIVYGKGKKLEVERRTQLVHIPTEDWILSPKMHPHREFTGGVLEDSVGVKEVGIEWASDSFRTPLLAPFVVVAEEDR